MSPETHLLASWILAAKTTDNARDCRLVALAGILPDADGLGLVSDLVTGTWGGRQTDFYSRYHHFLLHGFLGAVLITGLLVLFARRRWRVTFLCLIVFHLHLLCDLAGSRGPSIHDLWGIFYLGPFNRSPEWIWKGQWPLDAWPNRYLSAALLLYALWLAAALGYSFVGVFSRKLDEVFVPVLAKWRAQLGFGGNRKVP